jgi:hypothetical protein
MQRRFGEQLRTHRSVYLESLAAQEARLKINRESSPLRAFVDSFKVGTPSMRVGGAERFALACDGVPFPGWCTETQLATTPAPGGISTFERSTRQTGTLEIGASCGHWPPQSPAARVFPGQECPGFGEYNDANSHLGSVLTLPAHSAGLLTVDVQLVIDDLLGGGAPITSFPDQYVYTAPGNENVGINGGSAAWAEASMTLHTANGSSTVAAKVLGKFSAYGSSSAADSETGSTFTLSQTAAVLSTTSAVFLAVDLHAVAFAQGEATEVGQAFAQVELRDKAFIPIDDALGLPLGLARVRVRTVTAMFCEGAL